MIKHDEIFNQDQVLYPIDLNGDIVDTILGIATINESPSIDYVFLELRKCGLFLSMPDLRLIIDFLTKEKLLNKRSLLPLI